MKQTLPILALTLASLFSVNALAGYIEVSGSAAIELVPTTAQLTGSVVITAANPTAAKEGADAVIAKVLNAFDQQGISPQQYDAGQLQLGPQYQYDKQTRELVGYQANREVNLQVPTSDVGIWLAQFAELGLTQIDTPRYQAQLSQQQRAQLLQSALADARSKAEVLASGSQQRLGAVEQIEEVSFSAPRPMLKATMANAESYRAGSETEQVQLRVRFELND
ncbi:SIMPL domain-containing protein [Ferrimonas senticii]|uniref:SIMPL domain-containing protein n=1 Tax=Ferrimonas senticii TaxID=394566 RepID=UPI00042113B5|nr:SIMPL domain-containing protein [Ferrimonas senticii]